MSSLSLIGLNYRNAPLEVREKLAFDTERIEHFMRMLQQDMHLKEAVLLSTCNRTELYVYCESASCHADLLSALLHYCQVDPEQHSQYFYKKTSKAVIEHLFRVVSGLDSMVIGEDQILGQIKNAYAIAVEEGMAKSYFHKLFHQAFRVGKRVRNETQINSGAASVASVAIELSNKIFKTLKDKSILLVGAGDIAQVALMNLAKQGANHITVINRTLQKAHDMARPFQAQVRPFSELYEAMQEADIVITSTAAKQPIIKTDSTRDLMNRRKNRPLFLIDIAVPRDIDPGIRDLYNTFLYDIDDLEQVVAKTLDTRRKEIPQAEKIIEQEMASFQEWLTTQKVVSTIKELSVHMEELRKQTVEKNRKHFLQEDWDQMDKFSKSLLKAIMHSPYMQLHNGDHGCGRCTIRQVFGLE